MEQYKVARITAISTLGVALIGAVVTIFKTVYENEPDDKPDASTGAAIVEPASESSPSTEPPTGTAETAPDDPNDAIAKLKRMNKPLQNLSETTPDDLNIAARLSVHAPPGTLLDLDLLRGGNPVGQKIVGRIDDSHEESWNEGLHMVRTAALVPRVPGATGVSGEIVTSFGRTIEVDVTEPRGADLSDVYDMELVIDREGNVEIIHAVVCPWVYVSDGREWQRRVEIIQNLVGKGREKTQAVRLGTVSPLKDGEITIQIREELDEISYIDDLAIKFEGSDDLIRPARSSRDLDRLQRADGRYLRLEKDEMVEVSFFHDGFRAGRPQALVISATGYYDPVIGVPKTD